MKLFSRISLFFLLAFGLVLSSCSDDSSTSPTPTTGSYKLSCVVNGGTYSNQTFTFETSALGVYEPSEDVCVITFSNAAKDAAGVSFSGNKTGTFTVDLDKNAVVLTLTSTKTFIGLTEGTITVTTVGGVGGDIIGTFTGTGMVSKDNGIPTACTIKNGTFKAKRVS